MRRPNSDNGNLFYVVKFIEFPFANIKQYVCVPDSWMTSRTTSGEKAAVAYPNDEDPLTITGRVKNKEEPNDEWRLYTVAIEYESDTFENAEKWIETRSGENPCRMENSDSRPEPTLDRKLRSASHPFFSGTKFDKLSVSVKPYKNPRKPLPRISIRLPLPEFKNCIGTKRVKLDDIDNPVSGVINHPRIVSEYLKEKQSILVNDNQLIQSAQTGTAAALDDKTSSQHTLPDLIRGDESVVLNQSASPKLPHRNQPSPAGQIGEQALSLADNDTGFDEDDHEDDAADDEQSEPLMNEALLPGKTPANSPEQVPQSESVNEILTPLVHHKNSPPKQRLLDVTAEQSKEADVSSKTQLLRILTSPKTVPRLSRTPNHFAHGKYPQSAFLPSSSATRQNLRLQETHEGSSTEVTLNHPEPRSRGFVNNTLSPPYYVTNLMNPSTQLLHPSTKKKASSVIENPVAKRICLENITKNTSTRQEPSSSTARLHSFENSVVKQAPRLVPKHPEEAFRQPINNARSDFAVNAINLSAPQQRMNPSTAPNFFNLAEYSRLLTEQSQDRQYLTMQEYYSHLRNMFRLPNNGQSTCRKAHQPAMMHGEFNLQSNPKSIGQPYQLLPQYSNQYVPFSGDYMHEILKHRETSLRESIDGGHTRSKLNTPNDERNLQSSALNLSNQSHPNSEHSKQRQDSPRHQDLPGHFPKSMASSQRTERQGVIERTRSPSLPKTPSQPLLNAQRGYVLQDPRVRAKLNHNPTEHQILDPVVPGSLDDEVEPTSVNAEVQTAPLPDRLDETSSALLPGIGIVYRNRRTKKLVVDQATEMDPVMDANQCEEATESSDQSAPQVVDSGCQVDGDVVEEKDSPYQETDSESETSTHDVFLDDGECEDYSRADTVSENRPTSPQSLQMQQRLAAEQEMLNMYGTLFTQMGATFHYTRDLFNHLRNSIINCAEVYESLVEKIEKFNELEQLQIPTSLRNDETSRASKEIISENSSAENITVISSAPKMNHPQRNTFVLPPEYDPNNPKWTRKHQKKGPGLVELIARTNVFVSKKELKNCKREAKDCRSLARMLLTEVFSKNALSVCSLTGGKAKAFNSLNLDVRPGLDEDARMVLLTFVERYGAKRGWKTDDTSAIISSIRTKILEMRAKYGHASRG